MSNHARSKIREGKAYARQTIAALKGEPAGRRARTSTDDIFAWLVSPEGVETVTRRLKGER